ncbi:hypothetical protein QQ054_05340 [Oscillatoria amoena NRMC-F 0135]|nr:hypothetical protein [Oscillatoria amoena NRMC-F 0135]
MKELTNTKMVININDTTRIQHIKEEFNLLFPYLKLEFFSKPHHAGEGSPKMQITADNKTLGECRSVHNSGLLEIDPMMAVADLEFAFRDSYGLNIQVFRKSGKVWLETTVTDKWSLKEQNAQGELVTEHMTRQENYRPVDGEFQ